jgi:hypothetical protein
MTQAQAAEAPYPASWAEALAALAPSSGLLAVDPLTPPANPGCRQVRSRRSQPGFPLGLPLDRGASDHQSWVRKRR